MREEQKQGASGSAKPLLKKRVLLFKVISLVVVPCVILGVLEGSLRLFHYGHDQHLFMEDAADHRYLVMNPYASLKYFPDQKIATTGNRELFKKVKDPGCLRIFVLGESTTIGYPYFHNGSFHRWLAYRLMHLYPDKEFEMINLSLTAVNSYTVLGFARQLLAYQPDAILIYTGHNEYYGALGVGSTQRIGGSPQLVNLVLRLREFRIVQLLTHTYGLLKKLFSPRSPAAEETRMQFMVGDQQIPEGSVLYRRGIGQFVSNMKAVLQFFSAHHIPVFLSNLVSNIKDLPPFISIYPDSLRVPNFKLYLTQGLQSMNENKIGAADTLFKKANQLFDGNALCNYELGLIHYSAGEFGEAKQYFMQARDLDALRFRAPDTLNHIIAALCRQIPGTHLVDTREEFEKAAAHGIIGGELILDHVHPNLRGYALMSDAFYRSMNEAGFFGGQPEQPMGLDQLLRDMPVTQMDSLTGAYKMDKLKRSWPFNEGGITDDSDLGTTAGRLAWKIAFGRISWEDAMAALFQDDLSRKDLAQAKKVVEGLVLEHPTEAAYDEKAANLCGAMQDENGAAFYFKRAFTLAPSFERARYLFVLYLKLDRPKQALPYLDYAMDHNAKGLNLAPVRRLTDAVIALRTRLAADTLDVTLLNQIADKYLEMGNREGASTYVGKALKIAPGNKVALALSSRIKQNI